MKKISAFCINALTILSPFFFVSPVSAQCLAQDPIIGIISSISTNQYDSATITLSHVVGFNITGFSSNSANIDQYNTIAKAYMQNNFSLPSSYLASKSVSQSNYIIYASGSAIKTIPYQVGDIVMQGPPVGGSCTQYGFLGFFGKDGVIHYAVADDSSYFGYTYGSDTLSLSTGADSNCQSQSGGSSICQVPIKYTTHGISNVLVPGQTQNFSGSVFSSVTLFTSTHTIIPQNMWIEDFSPTALLHVITFGNNVITPLQAPTPSPSSSTTVSIYSANPTSGTVPLPVSFSVSNQTYTNIDLGDGNKAAPLNTSCTAGTPGCATWNLVHTYVYAGKYSALLMNGSQVVATIPISAGVPSQYINPNPAPQSGSCPIISRNLSRGSSGSDVSALQQFFITNGMIPSSLVSSPSGFFGALTEIAVQLWQSQRGLISSGTPSTTGYGAVGPRTRTSLSNCKN